MKLLNNTAPPRIHFTMLAQAKIDALVFTSKVEVAWHMTVHNPEPNLYIVTDVLVYPQLVSPAYVEASDDYNDWLADIPDMVFNNIRGQGHSHVKMGVGPSNTDRNLYDDMLTQHKDFYIFMIVNQAGATYFELYDMPKGILYYQEDMIISSDADTWVSTQLDQYVSPIKTKEVKTNGPTKIL